MNIEDMINKIHLGDCLDVMKGMPDKCIDLVLTDPPYGDGVGYGRNNKTILSNENPDINKYIMPDLYRILKDNTTFYCFTNWKYHFLVKEYAESVGFNTKMLLVIVKNNIGMGGVFRNQYELCWVFEKGSPEYIKQTSNVLKMEHIQHDSDTHPHQEGTVLIGNLIKLQNANTIFDPFSGSGTTAIACNANNRKFICIEKDPEYHRLSVERLKKEKLNLFANL